VQVQPPDHSLATWVYNVSQTVAGYGLTGIMGFVVVKRLRLDKRKLSEIRWSEAIPNILIATCIPITVYLTVGSYTRQQYSGSVAAGLLLVLLILYYPINEMRMGFWTRLFALWALLGGMVGAIMAYAVLQLYWHKHIHGAYTLLITGAVGIVLAVIVNVIAYNEREKRRSRWKVNRQHKMPWQ
jgi:hypothetical protein